MRMTEDRKRVFIDQLRRHGVISRAARSASPESAGSCVQSFRDELRRDPRFDARWVAVRIISEKPARIAA